MAGGAGAGPAVQQALEGVEDLGGPEDQPADGHLDARPVSTAVNNVRNNDPHLLAPVSL
ncbi:hypothetical protein [Streptomyces sp. NPDC048192]|uniref:hypothetical protein n=1 Tax=Streptomyces sp. NPDC048192 TaxID=3365510 RepID=UPI0037198E87